MGFFHEAHLVERDPEKMPDIALYRFRGISGNDKVEKSAPPDNARSYLVDQRPLRIAQFRPGKNAVNGFIEKLA
jgi:hypothetical protein